MSCYAWPQKKKKKKINHEKRIKLCTDAITSRKKCVTRLISSDQSKKKRSLISWVVNCNKTSGIPAASLSFTASSPKLNGQTLIFGKVKRSKSNGIPVGWEDDQKTTIRLREHTYINTKTVSTDGFVFMTNRPFASLYAANDVWKGQKLAKSILIYKAGPRRKVHLSYETGFRVSIYKA